MKKNMAYPYGVWMVVFIVCPILLIVLYAFSDSAGGFTVENFAGIVEYWPIFVRSFVLALISTVICLILSYPLAYKSYLLFPCISSAPELIVDRSL